MASSTSTESCVIPPIPTCSLPPSIAATAYIPARLATTSLVSPSISISLAVTTIFDRLKGRDEGGPGGRRRDRVLHGFRSDAREGRVECVEHPVEAPRTPRERRSHSFASKQARCR